METERQTILSSTTARGVQGTIAIQPLTARNGHERGARGVPHLLSSSPNDDRFVAMGRRCAWSDSSDSHSFNACFILLMRLGRLRSPFRARHCIPRPQSHKIFLRLWSGGRAPISWAEWPDQPAILDVGQLGVLPWKRSGAVPSACLFVALRSPLWVVTLAAQCLDVPRPNAKARLAECEARSRCFRPRAGRQRSDRLRQESRTSRGWRTATTRPTEKYGRQRHQRRRLDVLPRRRRVGRLAQSTRTTSATRTGRFRRRPRAIPPARGKPVRRAMRSASIARTARWDRSTTADSA